MAAVSRALLKSSLLTQPNKIAPSLGGGGLEVVSAGPKMNKYADAKTTNFVMQRATCPC